MSPIQQEGVRLVQARHDFETSFKHAMSVERGKSAIPCRHRQHLHLNSIMAQQTLMTAHRKARTM